MSAAADCPRCGRTYNVEPVDDPGVCCICTRDLREAAEHGPDWRRKVRERHPSPECPCDVCALVRRTLVTFQ